MRFLNVILLFWVVGVAKSQVTLIPDAQFENALINLGLDVGPANGSVPTANIDTVKSLSIGLESITDLTGIEDFADLKSLDCNFNNLSNLNVTQNIELEVLFCQDNQLTSIDLSQNLKLKTVSCVANQITSLDFSQNLFLEVIDVGGNQLASINLMGLDSLKSLYCNENNITKIDASQNLRLEAMYCNDNNLNCLNVKNGNNINMWGFFAQNNPNLICIEVDDTSYSTLNWSFVDPLTSFSSSCPNQCIVSVEEELYAELIDFFSNPTNGLVNISLKETTPVNLMLYNTIGQVLFSKNYASSNTIQLDLPYPQGIYFLRVETPTETFTKKLIKN